MGDVSEQINGRKKIFWELGENEVPSQFRSPTPFLSALIPRTVAWCTLANDDKIALLDGYTAACYSPPTLIFAAAALPLEFVQKLRGQRVCTLSVATTRDPESALAKAAASGSERVRAFTFIELGLHSSSTKPDYPPIVANSPIQMHCSLQDLVDLDENEGLVILTVDTFVIDASVLSPPSEEMVADRPGVVAKIDAELVRPIVGLGEGRFSTLALPLWSMDRPKQDKESNTWKSDPFDPAKPTLGCGTFDTVEWSYKIHGGTSPLGYNAVTALIMPRPIGWISTYNSDGVTHLAPYSFFTDVVRHSKSAPMVCFSGNRRNGEVKKDAQTDAETSGYFCYNVVTEDLAVNYSAAELERHESEFELAKLKAIPARTVSAPVVEASKINFECEYIKTVDVSNFSVVIGRVKAIEIDANVLTDGIIDPVKLEPVTRLGFLDEYGTLPK